MLTCEFYFFLPQSALQVRRLAVANMQQLSSSRLKKNQSCDLWLGLRGCIWENRKIRPSLQMDTFIIKLKYNIDALVFNLQFFYIKPD